MRHNKMWMAFLFIAVMLFGAALATAAEVVVVKNPPLPESLGKASVPPEGAFVDIIPHGRTATVVVRGLEVYRNWVYVYGAGTTEAYALVNGETIIPARRWVNMPFRGKDGLNHFLQVDDDDRFIPQSWMGPNVGIKPNTGKGSALTAREWMRPEYR